MMDAVLGGKPGRWPLLCAAAVVLHAALAAGGVRVDFGAARGEVKPLHGVNCSPMRHESVDKVYDQSQTELAAAGVPYYRLGATIEGYCEIKPYNILPPKDPAKWARICEHVIAHYNEGWADGYRWNIEYWEIWNEPEPNWSMWFIVTKEQVFELYETAAKHLKSRFPG
ncbi:MAG: hypothetical protein IJI35_00400, partial [Kiritimatiellae bacterium]|nr:hypothetical protein [Kiritimatiellia bacterium]